MRRSLRLRASCLATAALGLSLCVASGASAQSCDDWPGSWRDSNHEWNLRQIHESSALIVEMCEQHAIANWGQYPWGVASIGPWGVLGLLRNVSYNVRTEPVDGVAATPGQIGYVVVAQNGVNTGATLTQFALTSYLRPILVGSALEPLAITRPTRYLEGYAPVDPD